MRRASLLAAVGDAGGAVERFRRARETYAAIGGNTMAAGYGASRHPGRRYRWRPVGSNEGPSDDRALVAAAARGDTGALDTLLRRNVDRVHAICRRILANEHDAFDATQEALISIARGITTFDGRARFSTWCYRIATNAALDEARRRGRRPVPAETLPDRGDGSHEDRVTARIDVDAALARLAPEFRAAVALRDIAGLDYAEIADVLGIPPGTVRSRIARGRGALADALGNRDEVTDRPTPRTP